LPEVEIDGFTYSIGRLNAFQQFDLGRKILPFLPALLPALRLASKASTPDDMVIDLGEALQPLAVAMAGMSQADSNFILNSCLDVVRRRDATGNYRPVRAAGPLDAPGMLLFENEMDFTTLLRLAWEVIQANLGPSLQKSLAGSLGPPTQATPGISGSPTA
jgi:hypothetical protein